MVPWSWMSMSMLGRNSNAAFEIRALVDSRISSAFGARVDDMSLDSIDDAEEVVLDLAPV